METKSPRATNSMVGGSRDWRRYVASRINGTTGSGMSQRADGRKVMAGVRRWWWLTLLLFAAVGGAAGYVGSKEMEPVYQATTTLLVGDLTSAPNLTKDDMEASRMLASTYGTLIRGQSVLASVIQELGLRSSWQELKKTVHVDLGTADSHLITVDVFASSPTKARAIAAAVADQVVAISPVSTGGSDAHAAHSFAFAQVRELEEVITQEEKQISMLEAALASARTPRARAQLQDQIEHQSELVIEWQRIFGFLLRFLAADGSPNTLHVLQPAEAIASRIRPDMVVNTALGAAIGALIGLGITRTLALRRARRWGHAIGRGSQDRAGLSAAREKVYPHRVLIADRVAGLAALDSWVRELADFSGEEQSGSGTDRARVQIGSLEPREDR